MDNIVLNKITLEGSMDDIKNLYRKYTEIYPYKIIMNEEGLLVFSKGEDDEEVIGFLNPETDLFTVDGQDAVTGVPEGFKILTIPTYARFPDFTLIKPIPADVRNQNLAPPILEGVIDNWCLENWGVSENVRDFEFLTHRCVEFTTFWKGVPKLIDEMSKSFPDLVFHYEYADMDNFGTNCAKYIFVNGEIEKHTFEDGSKEAYEVLFNFIPDCKEDYELINGNYVFVDLE